MRLCGEIMVRMLVRKRISFANLYSYVHLSGLKLLSFGPRDMHSKGVQGIQVTVSGVGIVKIRPQHQDEGSRARARAAWNDAFEMSNYESQTLEVHARYVLPANFTSPFSLRSLPSSFKISNTRWWISSFFFSSMLAICDRVDILDQTPSSLSHTVHSNVSSPSGSEKVGKSFVNVSIIACNGVVSV